MEGKYKGQLYIGINFDQNRNQLKGKFSVISVLYSYFKCIKTDPFLIISSRDPNILNVTVKLVDGSSPVKTWVKCKIHALN